MGWAADRSAQGTVRPYYAGYLDGAVTELKGILSGVERNEPSQRGLNRAVRIAHSIKGNAAMYGEEALGEAAGRIEAALQAQMSQFDREATLGLLVGFIARAEGASRALDAPAADDMALPASVVPLQPAAPARPRERKRVLIAYSDPWICELLQSMIGEAFDVDVSQTVSGTIRKIAHRSPDLVVLEDRLGGQDGLDVVHHIRNSAALSAPDVYVAFEAGAPGRIAEGLGLGIAGFTDDKHQILDVAAFVTDRLGAAPQSVLVVDDDPLVRDLLARALRSDGVTVTTAADGIEALEALSGATPDLVILDRFMPRLEGGTVLYEMQSKINLKSIPVLVLTAMANHGEARSWFERGAADFIAKPFDPQEVVMRVRQHLGARKKRV